MDRIPKTIIISQPMFFPWAGTFEKVMLADMFLYDDDVQFPKGTFTNRVQIKTNKGLQWLTVPLQNFSHKTQTKYIQIDNSQDWKRNHLIQFHQHYKFAPYHDIAIRLMESVYSRNYSLIIDLAIDSVLCICTYLGIQPKLGFYLTSDFNVHTKKSQRIHDLLIKTKATKYICGSGNQSVQQRYLDHEAIESSGTDIEYIIYLKQVYPQLYGEFTPYVSALDLIANIGPSSLEYLNPNSRNWRLCL